MHHKAVLALVVTALSATVVTSTSAALAHGHDCDDSPFGRRFSDTRTLTSLPPATFPEGLVVEGHTAYVSGPATFGTAGQGPSIIRAFDTRNGEQIDSLTIAGEDLSQEHALSCITTDGAGRIYALSTQLGVVRIDPDTGAQEVYATIPHLAQCSALPPGPCAGTTCTPQPVSCASGRCLPPGPCRDDGQGHCLPPGPCQPVAIDRGSLANDLAFDQAGNLYITDSLQATIFKVPRGGGEAEAYFQSPAFDTSTIPGFSPGLNGIRLSPDRSKVVFTVSMGPNAGVWSIPRKANPGAASLQLVRGYDNYEIPDGIAFSATGRLYVALAGHQQIAMLTYWGTELLRFPSAAVNATLDVPYDNPANIAFNGRGSILVVNHAIFGDPAHAAVLDAMVYDVASPLAKPMIP